MSNVVIDIITQFSGKKAFKEADSAAAKLTGSVKKLGAALGIAFGARAIVRFATSSAKAFIEDEKATARLTQSVKNLGLALSATDINRYVERLSLQTGVVDDQLRPAMQSLLQVTGSVTKSQDLLNTAIETSRGSGEALSQVATDLAQAYVGNLKGLRKYNLGLTQAELKAMSFVEVQDRLNNLFKGSSKAYLNTFAGQWELLTTNIGEAKEVLGRGMIDALMVLSGDTTVEELAVSLNNAAKSAADATVKVAEMAKGFYDAFKPARDLIGGIQDGLQWIIDHYPSLRLMEEVKPPARAGRFFAGGQDSVKAGQAAAAEKAAKKRADDLLKLQKASTKAATDALKIKKAGGLLDIEQAGIVAALKGQITKEDETRLKLQFAILTGNTTEASKLAGELAKAQGLTQDLVDFYMGLPDAKNPFSGWITTLNDARQLASDIAKYQAPNISIVPPTGGTTGGGISTTSTAGNLFQSIVDQGLAQGQSQATINSTLRYSAMGQAAMNGGTAPEVNVTILLDGAEIAPAVTKVQTNGYLSGKIVALERTLGSFG
jgi:hypothetical protein